MRTLERREAKSNRIPDNRRAAARSRKGFTLPELLLVIGILAILAGVSFSALVKHRNDLRQTELDQRARAVFIAAQNQLTKLESTGVKADAAAYGGAELPGTPTDFAAVQAENAGAVAPNAYIAVTGAADTAAGNFMDGTSFSSGSSAENECYIVEYNKDTYAVYGAWYWEPDGKAFEKKSTFSKDFYAAGAGIFGTSDAAADLRTVKENRRKPSVGYYGGAASGKQMETAQADFTVSVNNGPRLELVIGQPASSLDGVISNGTFTIKISSATHKDNAAVYTLTAANGTVSASDGSSHASFSQITYDGNSYTFTLDSLEAGKHFADLFPAITAGDDLHISVTCSMTGTEKIYVPVTKDVETNSLFAGVRGSGSVSKVNAANGRHLQNLSPEISNLGYKKNGTGTSFDTVSPVTEARLTNDINWTETVYGSAEKPLSYDDASTAFGSSDAVHFYPIGNNIQSSRLVTVDGAGHKISNLHVTNYELSADKQYGYAGLFGYMSQDTGGNKVTIQNLTLVNPDIEPAANEPTGTGATTYAGSLAGWLTESTVTNCRAYLADADRTHSSDAATEAAYLSALYEGTEYEGTTQKTGVLAGSTYAGGLIGAAQAVTAENCSASVKVEAGTNAGGFIGTVSADSGAVNSITNCYAGGHTSDGSYSTTSYNVTSTGSKGSAGGFIGVPAGAAIEKSFSTCSASSATDGTNGPFAGTDPGTGVITETNIYAIGTTGSGTANVFGGTESAAVTGDESLSLSADATYSYDAAWRAAGSPAAQTAYPYRTWQNSFYGDWKTETESSVTPTFVYYEKYADGTYGLWSADQTSENKLNTLDDNKVIVSDGYAYLASSSGTKVSVETSAAEYPYYQTVSLSGTSADINGKSVTLYFFPWAKVIGKDFHSFNDAGGNVWYPQNKLFYDHQQLSVNGNTTDIYYNPHFAKSIAVDAAAAKKNPDTVEIRTARQLYELGLADNFQYGVKGYWNSDWDYRQTHDIDYREYTAETYEESPDIRGNQGVIGYDNYDSFRRIYDAGIYDENHKVTGRHYIRNLLLPQYDIPYISYSLSALFAYNLGTVENLILENTVTGDSPATYGGFVYQNLYGGIIRNCDLINEYIAAYYAGGLAYQNNGTIENCRLDNPVIYARNSSGMVYDNYGTIAESDLVNPKIVGTLYAAGFADNNYSAITGCHIYPQWSEGDFADRYDSSGLTGDTYTNALVVAPVISSGMTENNYGTIDKCSVTATVIGGTEKWNEVSVSSASIDLTSQAHIASGFVYSNAYTGLITSCYANCYTAGYEAVGFVYSGGGNGISDCYSLGKVASVGNQTAICSGFVGMDNNCSNCYTAASVKRYSSFSVNVGGTVTAVENKNKITAPFGSSGSGNNYYLDWNGYSNYSGTESAKKITYSGLLKSFGNLTPNAADAHPFDEKLASETRYPYVGIENLTMYGDWPLNTEFATKLAYFEIYKTGDNEYSFGFYMKDRDGNEFDSLQKDAENIYLDGYAILLQQGYADAQGSGSDLAALLKNGYTDENARTYITWNKNGNSGSDLSTKKGEGASEKALINPDTITGETDSDLVTLTGSDAFNGIYTFRILPFNAVVAGEDIDTSTEYQLLTFANGDDKSSYYYTPQFAKSIMYVPAGNKDVPSCPTEVTIRTPRQLCTMAKNYSGNLSGKNITYNQEADIDLSSTGTYSAVYGNIGFDTESTYQYRWFRTMIGSSSKPFTNTYNGCDHTVSGLGAQNGSNLDVPLFGYLSAANINKLTIADSSISGGDALGALCQSAIKSTVIDGIHINHVNLSPTTGSVGLLAGTVSGGSSVNNCTVDATATISIAGTATVGNIGGAVGLLNNGSIGNCSSDVSFTVPKLGSLMPNPAVTAWNPVNIGGFVGLINCGSVSGSHAGGAITSGTFSNIGGFFGKLDTVSGNTSVKDSFATGNVQITDTATGNYAYFIPSQGGFGGAVDTQAKYTATVNNCYSRGAVLHPDAFTQRGGFIGRLPEYMRKDLQVSLADNLIGIAQKAEIFNRMEQNSGYSADEGANTRKLWTYLTVYSKNNSFDSTTMGYLYKGNNPPAKSPLSLNEIGYPQYSQTFKNMIAEYISAKAGGKIDENAYIVEKYGNTKDTGGFDEYVIKNSAAGLSFLKQQYEDLIQPILEFYNPVMYQNQSIYETEKTLKDVNRLNLTDSGSYYNAVYKTGLLNQTMTMWGFLKQKNLVWINLPFSEIITDIKTNQPVYGYYINNIETYMKTASAGRASLILPCQIEFKEQTYYYYTEHNDDFTKLAQYGANYIYNNIVQYTGKQDKDITAARGSCSMSGNYFQRDDGTDPGVPELNSEYQDIWTSGTGIEARKSSEF